jgi:type VI secretion system protein ImpB
VAIQDELPQSRITLKYRTTINGEEEEIKLPMRTLVMGDFGSSKDRANDFDQRELRTITGSTNLDEMMKDMEIELDLQVANKITPEKGDLDVKIPITRIKSFNPEEVAKNIPSVKSLMLIKELLLEMQSNIDNRRDIRKLILEICSNPERLKSVISELKGYETLRLPSSRGQVAEDAEAAATAAATDANKKGA